MKNVWKVLRVLLGITILVVGIVQLGTSINNSKVEREAKEQQAQVAVDTLKAGYDQLEIGMTYDECVSILGAEGESFSESESEYFGKSSIYLWKPEGELFTGIEAHFDNDGLSSKTWVD